VREEHAFVALDEAGAPVGFALARRKTPRQGVLSDLYVQPAARRAGAARALVREVVAAFAADRIETVTLEVGAVNDRARSIYSRWGFREHTLELFVPLATLAERLRDDHTGRTFGSVHVQTDDQAGIERAVRQFVPRLPGGSRGSIVSAPRNGWIAVYDDVCERDPQQLRRLAKELGDRTGGVVLAIGVEQGAVVRFVLFERGSVVDEYLSVQEHYGPLPPGDVIALAANPRVVSRLTGADIGAVRAAAVHAASPQDLPPPEEILAGIAAAMRIEGAEHGWSDAPELPGAVRIER
jgi:predicted GNAT family acetyltransferase